MKRLLPNIIVCGTPGVGKSRLAEALSSETGFRLISINEFAKQNNCLESWDDGLQTWLIDDDKLIDLLEEKFFSESKSHKGGIIFEWHSCDIFPERWIDLVIVLQCNNTLLYDRLVARGYSRRKIEENIDTEIMRVILEEAHDNFVSEIVVNLPSESEHDLQSNIERSKLWIETWKQNNLHHMI